MVDHPADSGYELVLDNRKLIIAFLVLVVTWLCFFVVGFMEGKRQGYQAGAQTVAETAVRPGTEEPSAPADVKSASTDSEAKAKKEGSEEKPLNWYKDVSGRGEKAEIAAPKTDTSPARKTAASKSAVETASKAPASKPAVEPAPKAPASHPPSTSATYSVQVGAFRQRQQAEVKAQLLQSKGFEGRIEPPDSPEGLYLLKVGRFKSRAEAIAVQLRLKKNGFSSFIKSN
jgi:cell division protein FtsN